MNANTPKKKVVRKGRGRKPNLEVEASDFCRICKVNFKKNGTYISSDNLFTTSKPGGPLSEIPSSKLKLFLTCASNLSSRFCAKCALKIRNASSNFILVEENLNVPRHNFQESAVEENDDTERFKRCSKSSPGLRSEKRRKADRLNASKETGRNRGAKRPLLFGNAQQYCETVAGELPDLVMEIDSSLCGKSTSLEVDVNLHFPSGDRKKLIEDDRAKSLIKNVAQQNWKAAVNIVFKHPACQDHIKEAIRSSVSREFKEYCHSTTSVLKYATPSELSSFSNNLVQHEVATYCPLWHSALVGAMGPCKKEDKAAKAVNVTSLCSAAVAKFRNQRMSAYAHRISVILIHSGAKSQDFRRLNQLGICMSHGETIKKQKEMARAHDAAVLIWKKEVEFSKKCMLLLQEIQKRQVPVFEEDDMEVEIILDLSLPTVCSYEHYTEQAFAKCLQVINKELSTAGNSVATSETLEMAIKAMSGEFVSLPKYR